VAHERKSRKGLLASERKTGERQRNRSRVLTDFTKKGKECRPGQGRSNQEGKIAVPIFSKKRGKEIRMFSLLKKRRLLPSRGPTKDCREALSSLNLPRVS